MTVSEINSLNSKWLHDRGLRSHARDDFRLMLLSHTNFAEMNIEIINEVVPPVWVRFSKDSSVYKRMLANHNMRQICPFFLNLDTLAAKDIPFPLKTTGYWYYFGNEIGFQNNQDKTWFIMTNDLTNPDFVL